MHPYNGLSVTEMKDLSQAVGVVAIGLEILRQRHDFRLELAELGNQVRDFCRIRPLPGQLADPRRMADRLLTVGALKDSPHGSQPIEIGRLHHSTAIATKLWTQIINGNEKNIGTCRHLCQ